MRYEQAKAVFRSLRFRLTAWNTAVVLLTVLLALFGVREGLRLSLIDELEKSLVDDSIEVSLTVEQVYPDLGEVFNEMNRKVKGHEDRDLFVELLADKGEVLWSSDNTPPLNRIALPSATGPALGALDSALPAGAAPHRPGRHPGLYRPRRLVAEYG